MNTTVFAGGAGEVLRDQEKTFVWLLYSARSESACYSHAGFL